MGIDDLTLSSDSTFQVGSHKQEAHLGCKAANISTSSEELSQRVRTLDDRIWHRIVLHLPTLHQGCLMGSYERDVESIMGSIQGPILNCQRRHMSPRHEYPKDVHLLALSDF